MSTNVGSIVVPLFPAGTTTGTSRPFKFDQYQSPTIYFRGAGTISTGTVVLEEAHYGPTETEYSGSWSIIVPSATPTYSVDLTALSGGAQAALHITGPNGYSWLRLRVVTNVTGSGGGFQADLVAVG